MLYKREKLEEIELNTLAPYALKSVQSQGRVHPEPESNTRTAYERDRDRIIHTTAFRRLEYKTQVFVFYEGDHYRTRLTHTLEVAQIGRSLARGLGANQELTEAICLAHDLGHPPFGHSGEKILNEIMADYGGFNHNTQSYRIVTHLARRYPDFNGLNLTYETREGMIKHETSYDKSDATGYAPERRASLEAQISNLADEIAYNAHDLEDGLRAGLFAPHDLETLVIWQELAEAIGWQKETPFSHLIRHHLIRELIGQSIINVLTQTTTMIETHQLNSPEAIQMHQENVVGYTAEFGEKIKTLKGFLLSRMYRHYRLMRMQVKAEHFLSQLFKAYVKEPRMLPQATQQRLKESPLQRVVTDYIAGMTDRYALDEWHKLFDPYYSA